MKNIHHDARIHSGNSKDKIGDITRMIDHSLLKPDATISQIIQLCKEAKKNKFACVCINPCYIPICLKELKGSQVKVCTVIGFPSGAPSTNTKIYEAKQALHDGAREIDMVINIGMLKSGNLNYIEKEISAIVNISHKFHALVKVIIETALLTNKEKVKACLIAKRAGADFIKTSTGFSKGGATTKDVALMRKTVGTSMGIKASGGIRSGEMALAMIESGADRIGTSESVKLIYEFIKINKRQQNKNNRKK
jgi:deoxyribose-phosphate aldolase